MSMAIFIHLNCGYLSILVQMICYCFDNPFFRSSPFTRRSGW